MLPLPNNWTQADLVSKLILPLDEVSHLLYLVRVGIESEHHRRWVLLAEKRIQEMLKLLTSESQI